MRHLKGQFFFGGLRGRLGWGWGWGFEVIWAGARATVQSVHPVVKESDKTGRAGSKN